MALEPGATAPDFTLPDQHGNPVTLSDLRGKTVVLYFYPKADTLGSK
jgi:peroxiredoxin Q/BCP